MVCWVSTSFEAGTYALIFRAGDKYPLTNRLAGRPQASTVEATPDLDGSAYLRRDRRLYQ
jgi:hypothetical protein